MRQFRILTVATLIALALGTFQSAAPAGAMNRLTVTTTPTYLYFGNVIVGITSPTQTITIRNTGSTDVTLGMITVTTTTATKEFVLKDVKCINGQILAPNDACSLAVSFKPSSLGYKSGSVNILNSESATPTVVSLSGYGIAGTNLLLAPNFDLPFTKPIPWKGDPKETLYLPKSVDCSISVSPLCSVRLRGTSLNYAQSFWQSIGRAGAIGDRYLFRLSSRARGIPAGGQYKVEVLLMNMYNRVVGTKVINFANGTHGFQTVTGSITAKAQYSWVIFRFTLQKPSGTAWFDNAQLIYIP
ncbi:MAG: choice-of-anchor D domain-containing protein [Anaerolineaceae bacterium]|nr:MAG: choice-of-anchor D domain-containing protein [Anaerolineaceae bacterium]